MIKFSAIILFLLTFLLLGCQVEPYNFGDDTENGGGVTDSETGDEDDDTSGGGDSDSGTDNSTDTSTNVEDTDTNNECSVSTGTGCKSGETCCENLNGVSVCVNLDVSLSHCGGCNESCSVPNATAVCDNGECKLSVCESYWYDANSSDSDGCEYYCQPTVDASKHMDRCDGIATSGDPDNDGYEPRDNDCDGEFDEDVDFLNDVQNCGYCGNVCLFNHAEASCENGVCTMGDCLDNWYNIETGAGNGCETYCTGSPSSPEVCNLLDDNCDGQTDEGNPGGGGACYTDNGPDAGCYLDTDSSYKCKGECSPGSLQCSGGRVDCTGSVLPSLEVCDGLDNNCNGLVDEGLSTGCGGNPTGSPDEGLCSSGVALCDSQHASPGNPVYDTDNCQGSVTPSLEMCDGYDNDCDGLVDEDSGSDGNNNNVDINDNRLGISCGLGACSGNTQVCIGGQVKCEGGFTPAPEEACNMVDDDCDGQTDELVTYQCEGSHGVVCNDTDGDCDSYSEGICQAGTLGCDAGHTQICKGSVGPSCADSAHCDDCDGFDNDCDGLTDEDAFYGISDVTCGSPCHNGHLECNSGSLECVGEGTPVPDMCNGVNDNISEDCNTSTLDGEGDTEYHLSCDGPDAGDCKEGFYDCQGGVKFCNEDTDADIEDKCDGIDNDCDGLTDDADGDLAAYKPTAAALGCDPCPGTTVVVCDGSGGWRCKYDSSASAGVECLDADCYTHAAVESSCDTKDGDCDGVADDDFQTGSSVDNCGGCGNVCSDLGWQNVSSYYCDSGDCKIKSCTGTFVDADLDADTDNGCECTPHGVERCDDAASLGRDDDCNGAVDENASIEVCDGEDNDCDGLTDLADSDLTAPSYVCNSSCGGTAPVAVCVPSSGEWACMYDTDVVELDTSGGPVANESWCDGLDNDCDGLTDEGPGIVNAEYLGQSCNNDDDGDLSNGPLGICLVTGKMACVSDKTADPVCCSADESPCVSGAVADPDTLIDTESNYEPNGLDDDCDGLTDEGLGSNCITSTTVPYAGEGGSKNLNFDIVLLIYYHLIFQIISQMGFFL